jgi:hypothetical protein
VQAAFSPGPDALVVIVGKFHFSFSPQHREGGLGHTQLPNPSFAFRPCIYINSDAAGTDGVTLLHEMGHASGCDLGGLTEADWRSLRLKNNFMSHFRAAFARRRCLVPADGFYEWAQGAGKKQPIHFRLRDGGLFAFAGPWVSNSRNEGPACLAPA